MSKSRPSMSKENCDLLNRAIDETGLPRDEAIATILLNHELTAVRVDKQMTREQDLFMAKGKLSFYRVFTGTLIALIGVMAYVGDFFTL